MARKKVVHLANVDQTISLFLMPQLQELQEKGYEVHAICPLNDNKNTITQKGIIAHHVEVTRDITFIKDVIMFFRLWYIMVRQRFYIVHAHSAKMEFFGQLAARLSLTPIVLYTNHGMIFRSDMPKLKRSVLKLMARFSGVISDHIFSQSEEDINHAISHNIYPQKKLSYLGNGIDITNFDMKRFPKESLERIKLDLGIPTDGIVIGIVARFVKEKGYPEFFSAARMLRKIHENVFFLCVGNDVKNERDPVDFNVLDEWGLEESFTILKSQKDMPRLYAVMDIVVLPSFREGFPRTLMEAAAMSKPTVASDISGCREAVMHDVNGLLFSVGDACELAESVDKILTDRQRYTRYAKKGRELAETNFDQRKVVDRLLEVYGTLLKKHDVPSR